MTPVILSLFRRPKEAMLTTLMQQLPGMEHTLGVVHALILTHGGL